MLKLYPQQGEKMLLAQWKTNTRKYDCLAQKSYEGLGNRILGHIPEVLTMEQYSEKHYWNKQKFSCIFILKEQT